MTTKRSVKGVAQRESRAEKKIVKAATNDSFQNFSARLGMGADNLMSASQYGFNPITRTRTLLEWIHRGSWLGGVAVDVVADDMTRAGVDLKGQLHPDQVEQIQEAATGHGVWNAINDTIKWSRLYGGCIAVMLIDGQDPATPLRLQTIKKGQFRGLLVLDRWMVEPTLEDLVQDYGPDLGLPKFYKVTADAPALPRMKIHYSRCLRLEGIRLPYWQRVMENMWGISVLERLYDRMIAFDSATTGAAQLVYKSYLRTFKVENLREIASAGGPALQGLTQYVNMMARFQSIEGITMIDANDDFVTDTHSAFSGLDSVIRQLGEQLSGSLQIPLVRLFGQSPGGIGSDGESALRTYYDGINNQQSSRLGVPVTRMYRAIAASEGIKLSDGFKIEFRSLWQLTSLEKAEIANKVADAVTKVDAAGITSPRTNLEELRASSHITGIFASITDEDVAKAADVPEAPIAEIPGEDPDSDDTESAPGETKDSLDSFSLDAEWVEGDHPRKDNGEFGSGGGSSSPVRQSLTANEKSSLSSYSGDDFLRINKELREGNASDPTVARIDSAIAKSPLGKTTLYRGMSREAAKKLFPDGNIVNGMTISDPAFASTSKSSNIAGMIGMGGVVLKIEAGGNATGIDMAKHSRNEHEQEVLLPRNAKMKVVGLTPPKLPGGAAIVRVRYGD